MTERDHVLEEARTAVARLRAGVPAGTPMHLGNLLNAVLARVEDVEKALEWEKHLRKELNGFLLARAEAAEKERDEVRSALLDAHKQLGAWMARAEAAEKEAEEFRRALDKGLPPTIEAQSEINHWRERAEAAEAELELAMQRLSDMGLEAVRECNTSARSDAAT